MDSWSERQLLVFNYGGNRQLQKFLESNEVTTDSTSRYLSVPSKWYRDEFLASRIEGRPVPIPPHGMSADCLLTLEMSSGDADNLHQKTAAAHELGDLIDLTAEAIAEPQVERPTTESCLVNLDTLPTFTSLLENAQTAPSRSLVDLDTMPSFTSLLEDALVCPALIAQEHEPVASQTRSGFSKAANPSGYLASVVNPTCRSFGSPLQAHLSNAVHPRASGQRLIPACGKSGAGYSRAGHSSQPLRNNSVDDDQDPFAFVAEQVLNAEYKL